MGVHVSDEVGGFHPRLLLDQQSVHAADKNVAREAVGSANGKDYYRVDGQP